MKFNVRKLLILVSALFFVSCSDSVNSGSNYAFFVPSKKSPSRTFSGTVSMEGVVPSELIKYGSKNSRTLVPSVLDVEYKVTAKCYKDEDCTNQSGSDISVPVSDGAFTMELYYGWYVFVVEGMSEGKAVLHYDNTLTPIHIDDSTLEDVLNFQVKPYEGGTGHISISVGVSSSSITKLKVNYKKQDAAEFTNEEYEVTGSSVDLSYENVDAGLWFFQFEFYNDTKLVFRTPVENVNVFKNLTTDTWISNNAYISEGNLNIDDACVEVFVNPEFYIDSDVSDENGKGTYFKPCKSISGAVLKANEYGLEEAKFHLKKGKTFEIDSVVNIKINRILQDSKLEYYFDNNFGEGEEKPVIKKLDGSTSGRFYLYGGTISFKNIVIDGSDYINSDEYGFIRHEGFGKLEFINCEIRNFSTNFLYLINTDSQMKVCNISDCQFYKNSSSGEYLIVATEETELNVDGCVFGQSGVLEEHAKIIMSKTYFTNVNISNCHFIDLTDSVDPVGKSSYGTAGVIYAYLFNIYDENSLLTVENTSFEYNGSSKIGTAICSSIQIDFSGNISGYKNGIVPVYDKNVKKASDDVFSNGRIFDCENGIVAQNASYPTIFRITDGAEISNCTVSGVKYIKLELSGGVISDNASNTIAQSSLISGKIVSSDSNGTAVTCSSDVSLGKDLEISGYLLLNNNNSTISLQEVLSNNIKLKLFHNSIYTSKTGYITGRKVLEGNNISENASKFIIDRAGWILNDLGELDCSEDTTVYVASYGYDSTDSAYVTDGTLEKPYKTLQAAYDYKKQNLDSLFTINIIIVDDITLEPGSDGYVLYGSSLSNRVNVTSKDGNTVTITVKEKEGVSFAGGFNISGSFSNLKIVGCKGNSVFYCGKNSEIRDCIIGDESYLNDSIKENPVTESNAANIVNNGKLIIVSSDSTMSNVIISGNIAKYAVSGNPVSMDDCTISRNNLMAFDPQGSFKVNNIRVTENRYDSSRGAGLTIGLTKGFVARGLIYIKSNYYRTDYSDFMYSGYPIVFDGDLEEGSEIGIDYNTQPITTNYTVTSGNSTYGSKAQYLACDYRNEIGKNASGEIILKPAPVYSISYECGNPDVVNPEGQPAQFYSNDKCYVEVQVPERSGYDFEGWFTSPDYNQDSAIYNSDEDKYILPCSKYAENITLYAKWEYSEITALSKNADGYYVIDSKKAFDYVGSLINNNSEIEPGVSANTANYVLGSDVNFKNSPVVGWGKTGTDYYFQGKFNGAGHSIYNLKFDSGTGNNALFRYCKSAVIFNIREISGNSEASTLYIAGLIANAYGDIEIRDVVMNFTVDSVGGANVAGFVSNVNGKVTFVNCINKGNIVAANIVGGFVANVTSSAQRVLFINCANIGNHRMTSNDNGGVGGFVGNVNGNNVYARNCYNTGVMTRDYSGNISHARVGQFVGYLGSDVSSSTEYTKRNYFILGSQATGGSYSYVMQSPRIEGWDEDLNGYKLVSTGDTVVESFDESLIKTMNDYVDAPNAEDVTLIGDLVLKKWTYNQDKLLIHVAD